MSQTLARSLLSSKFNCFGLGIILTCLSCKSVAFSLSNSLYTLICLLFRWLTSFKVLKVFVVAPPHEAFCLQELQTAYFVSSATEKKDQIGDYLLEVLAIFHTLNLLV